MKNHNKFTSFAIASGFLITSGTVMAQAILIDHTFDGVANDTGGLEFQAVTNGIAAGGSSNLSTGTLTTGDGVTPAGFGNSAYGFNTKDPINVGALAPAATGFEITFTVSATDVAVSDLAYNGLFFGVVSGTDANGVAGGSLYSNNPYAFGYVAGSGEVGGSSNGYGDNVMRQDAQGGAKPDVTSINTALGGTAPTNASFQDGFTVTISLFNDETWTIASTGLSTDLNGSGSLTSTDPNMFDYATIAGNLTPYVSLQGEASGTITIDQITITAVPEPSSAALLGLAGLALILRRRRA